MPKKLIPVRECNTGEMRATRYDNGSMLQCVAVCCSMLHMIRLLHLQTQPTQWKAVQNSVHVAMCCSVLQCVALDETIALANAAQRMAAHRTIYQVYTCVCRYTF